MSRKVTLAHDADGMVTHATMTGFDGSDEDLATMRAVRDAIDRRVRVIVFDSSIEVEHVYATDTPPTRATRDDDAEEAL